MSDENKPNNCVNDDFISKTPGSTSGGGPYETKVIDTVIYSSEQESYYCMLAQNGSIQALDHLVTHFTPLLVKLSFEHFNRYETKHGFLDLIAQAKDGAITAIHKFDDNIGIALATFVGQQIQAIHSNEVTSQPVTPQKIPKNVQREIYHRAQRSKSCR